MSILKLQVCFIGRSKCKFSYIDKWKNGLNILNKHRQILRICLWGDGLETGKESFAEIMLFVYQTFIFILWAQKDNNQVFMPPFGNM